MEKLTFNIEIPSDINVNYKAIEKGDLKAIIDVEGDFKIYINDKLYFHEELFPILELLIELIKWIREGQKNDFVFTSIEHPSPILQLTKSCSKWEFKSDWGIFKPEHLFSSGELYNAVEQLNREFNQIMIDKYSVKINIERLINK